MNKIEIEVDTLIDILLALFFALAAYNVIRCVWSMLDHVDSRISNVEHHLNEFQAKVFEPKVPLNPDRPQ